MNHIDRRNLVDKLLTRLVWMRTREGLDKMAEKQCETQGVIRTAILLCFDEAEEQGIGFVDMLKNTLLCCAAEHDEETRVLLYALLEVMDQPAPYGTPRITNPRSRV